MNELYEMSSEFWGIHWKLKSLLYVLEQLENEADGEEMEWLIGFLKYYLGCLEVDLNKWVKQLDLYELKNCRNA